ncbi:hypothetical protein FHS85_002875 [Rhodoligotrophos appendicifer]|nr:hypothetical protein [Rhodoligotrophos appendicifer]
MMAAGKTMFKRRAKSPKPRDHAFVRLDTSVFRYDRLLGDEASKVAK